ncbi:DUF4139 domain-containing protein [Rhodomicrobium sp. Az07]|uniref:DUF4139 domain-containing protein n=1 Tax=Rhodomicrobium sp. Az07 TaxID=2839034 RepID=UPI001BEA4D61|nr:DUF4139 domain-containing protein [Rhodomicrobium sp. Az07]MBT3070124.1 DUF4139 domain-containing protein [Rhodomicrobium sp. Az07]
MAEASELPLKRVVLSSSGLAQFTHAGEVAPGAALTLPVRVDQVDDVLKSLTLFTAPGTLGAVSLPGKTPLAELFRDLPFDQSALASQAALLDALVGAEVEIEGSVNATGRIFRVEDETAQLPNNGGVVRRHRLTLLTPKGMVQAVLEDLTALRFADPATRAQVDKALTGLAGNRAKDLRTLSISLTGDAKAAAFSYVVAAPVWKTAYRLVLPKDGGNARLQGWGVLENLTGGDWKDVELTLVSGNPVALKQQLYTAVFVDRPEIPVTAGVRIVPRKDEAEARKSMRAGAPAYRAAPAPMAAMAKADGEADAYFAQSLGSAAKAPDAEEAATQVLYRFPGKVTLASGSTLMVPFVDADVSASRTFIYQRDTNERHPLAAVRLTNDGASALPGGIITAFETGGDGAANFAGDAQLPLLPKGATRFVTFALDGRTDIRRIDHGVKRARLGRAVAGTLTLTTKSRWAIDYEITPPATEDREVVIDEPRADGWKPLDAKDVEETATRLRQKVNAPTGKTTRTTLSRERVDQETVVLTSLSPDEIVAMLSGLENASPALKDTVAKLGSVVDTLAKLNNRKEEIDGERKKIADDQDRIRKNLASVGQGTDLGRRYLDLLKTQEDRLAAFSTEERKIEGDIAAANRKAEEIAETLVL